MEIKYYGESIITPLHRNEVIQLQHNIQILSDKNTKDRNRNDFFVEFKMGATPAVTNAYDTQNNDVEKKRTKEFSDWNREEFRDFLY